MKKIAIIGSGNGSNFEALAKYLKHKCEIICISDAKDSYILKRAENLGIEANFVPYEENFTYFKKNQFDLVILAGYMKILTPEVLSTNKFINIHPSILPAFKGKDAIKQAFLEGVKVSGVTIHWVSDKIDEGKIIAQYPVFIDNCMNFSEFEQEIHTIEHKLYPIVVEKILEDKIFDFQDLMKSSCSGGCGGSCKG